LRWPDNSFTNSVTDWSFAQAGNSWSHGDATWLLHEHFDAGEIGDHFWSWIAVGQIHVAAEIDFDGAATPVQVASPAVTAQIRVF
jgi:hypothetical protein